MEEKLTSDEWRLLNFFRCLSPEGQSKFLFDVGSQAMEECIPDKSIYELMPTAAGVSPEGIDYIEDTYSIAHIIYSGIQETGEPFEILLGSSDFDEEEVIPRFTNGAEAAALEQRSVFNYSKEFARKYVNAWRVEIVNACLMAKKEGNKNFV